MILATTTGAGVPLTLKQLWNHQHQGVDADDESITDRYRQRELLHQENNRKHSKRELMGTNIRSEMVELQTLAKPNLYGMFLTGNTEH